ncbi:MAG: hypothetical protein ACREDR_01605 [Blastocatellia bacterium]
MPKVFRTSQDIDGCCANLYGALLIKASQIGLAPLPSWNEIHSYKDPFPGFYSVYSAVERDLEFWSSLPVLDRPPYAPTVYLSHRPSIPGLIEITRQWLRRNGLPAAPIYFVDLGGPAGEYGKALAMRDLDIDLMIEDSGHTYRLLRELGLKAKLLDRPWNRDVDAGADRVPSLTAAYN